MHSTDMVCAAHYALDDAWYRAQVIELPGHSMVKVRYVDYGNEEYVTNWELQKLVDKYMVLPIQVVILNSNNHMVVPI